MAEQMRGQAQSDRAKSRERRRTLASKPFDELDEAAGDASSKSSDTFASAKNAARKAASAAIAGGLAGAAKALLDRRSRSNDEDAVQPQQEQQSASSSDEGSMKADPEKAAETAETGQRRREVNSQPPEPKPEREREDEDEAPPRSERDEPQQGAAHSDVTAMVKRARQQITDLLGREPESISGVQHANGSWSVIVEVVEIHRIPDTTDILSSYEVVLDNDGDLVRLDRRRRYRRSQVEEDR